MSGASDDSRFVAAARRWVLPSLELRMTRYQQAALWMTSALVLLGLVTAVMFAIWVSRREVWKPPLASASILPPGPAIDDRQSGGGALAEFQPPGASELADVLPRTSAGIRLNELPAIVESQVLSAEALRNEGGDGRRSREQSIGNDDGPSIGDDIGRMDSGRWEIRFSVGDLEEYKRQLDQFGIELGIAGGGDARVHYVKDFTAASPTVRIGSPKDEKRLRFLWADGRLKQADRDLARAAGIPVDGRIVFQFYSRELYDTLLKLENDKMKPRPISEVVRTVFGCRRVGDRYELYVIRIDFRHPVIVPRPTMTSISAGFGRPNG